MGTGVGVWILSAVCAGIGAAVGAEIDTAVGTRTRVVVGAGMGNHVRIERGTTSGAGTATAVGAGIGSSVGVWDWLCRGPKDRRRGRSRKKASALGQG